MTTTVSNAAENSLGSIRAAALRLRNGLLQGPCQLRSGPEAGAIAGSLDEHGRARYAYAEITGYYLHWLSELAADKVDERATAAAHAALHWFCRSCSNGGLPATRIAQFDEAPDWRNDAVFCFDLGMLVNGAVSALQQGLAADAAQHAASLVAIDSVIAGLQRHIADDGLRAAVSLNAAELPRRWSTLGGAFLAKPAVRILQVARLRPLPDRLASACQAEIDRCHAGAALSERPLLLHPLLYAAEGLTWAAPDRPHDIAAMLQLGLDLVDDEGRLPETAYGDTGPRNDVAAQALRIGVWLQQHAPAHAPVAAAMAHLAELVAKEVRADGSMPFRPQGGRGDTNIWCALFAEQALRWWIDHQDGKASARGEFLV